MDLLSMAPTISAVAMALLALILAILQRNGRVEIQKKEEIAKQRLYQISILKEIQERIGYTLDIENIIDVITGSLRHLFPYSAASSMLIRNDRLIFKVRVEESISSYYINQVRNTMLASLQQVLPKLPPYIEDSVTGVALDNTKNIPVASFFNIPLVIGNEVVGLINISSASKKNYREDEVTILYQIVAQASNAISRLEDVLVTEKGKLTSMIASLADGVFMVDRYGNLTIINDAARMYLNLTQKNPTLTDIVGQVGNQYNLLAKIETAIKTNSPIEEKEVTINDRIFQTFITPVPDATKQSINKTIGASILLHDITLEKNVTRIKEDFTHMIVHELRAPLTAIKDSSELMIEVFEDRGNLEKEQQERLLKIIDLQSKNLLEQINQVLDAAKIEAGSFSINKVASDMGEIIQNAIEPFLPQASKQQKLISTDIYYPLPKVDVDPVRINQVLTNLISNSLKFTPAGGKIIVSAKPGEESMVVSVTDNGIGIPEGEQKDLFSKYYQIRTTPRQLAKKGTGLGLYITKGIVEAHGGTVGVNSKPGQGTTISFTLPAKSTGPMIINPLQQQKASMASNLPN